MRFWKKKEPKEEPKEEPKRFEPCFDTLLWLWKEEIAQEEIREIIEGGDYDAELCPVCKTEWVYEGQWNWYVKDEYMHKVRQELSNGIKLEYALNGYTDKCCEVCYYEDSYGCTNMNLLEDYELEIWNGYTDKEVTA